LTLRSVGYWRKRYLSQGIAGLEDICRPGRPRGYDDDSVATRRNQMLKDKPRQATHWRARLAAEETGISKGTVQRDLHLFGCNPIAASRSNSRSIPSSLRKCAHRGLLLHSSR